MSNAHKISLILLLAFLLRMNGLDFGLPYVFHDDEHQYVEAGVAFLEGQAAIRAGQEKLNNPPLFKSGLGLLYVLYSRLLIGDPEAIQAAAHNQQWRTFFHYVGRFATVSLGLLTVALLYAIGKRLYSPKTGLLAALLLTVSFLPVRESHFAVNDTPLAFMVAAVLYTGAGILRRGRWFDYLLTGLLIGLAGAVKYTGVYLVSILIMAHWLRQRQTKATWRAGLLSPRWWAGLFLVPVGFLVGAPVVLTAWAEMFRRMSRLAEYGRLGYHDLLLAPYGGWLFYLNILAWGLGFLLLGLCLVALVGVLMTRYHEDLLLVVFPLLLYVIMAQQKLIFARFILPALPPLLLLAAIWLRRFSHMAPRLSPKLTEQRVLTVATLLLIIQPLLWSIWLGVLLSRPDTRETATDWIAENIPSGAIVYAEDHAIPKEGVAGRVSWPHVHPPDLAFDSDIPDPLAHYQAQGTQFILTSDYHHQRRFTDPTKETGRQQWAQTLSHLTPLVEFQPYWQPAQFTFTQRYGPWLEAPLRHLPGPTIRVYALDSPPTRHYLNPLDEANQIPDKAHIFAYELTPNPTQAIEISLYWVNKGWQPSDELRVTLVDSAGFEAAQTIAQPAPAFANALAQGQKMIKSEAHLPLPPGTPPGPYRLHFSIFDTNKLETVGLVNQTPLTLTQPISPPQPNDLPDSDTHPLTPGFSLISHNLHVDDEAMQNTLLFGQDNWLTLLWQADKKTETDYQIQLTLLDPAEKVAAVWAGHPVHGQSPTSNWQTGQLIRDPWNLTLPDTLPDTQDTPYTLRLTLLNPDNSPANTVDLDTVQLSGHARSSAIPTMQQTVNAVWADAFSLLGFNIRAIPESADSGWLELDLYWQSLAPLDTNYVISLRLIDNQGQTILSQDTQPSGGQAPTSNWQPGEVIHDFHSLRYEKLTMSEQYRLELILINAQTGETLPGTKNNQTTDSLLLTAWP